MTKDLYLGLDLGTSGARASIIDTKGVLVAEHQVRLSGTELRNPDAWWLAAQEVIAASLSHVRRKDLRSIAVSATSGTVLAIDESGQARGDVLIYSDACPDDDILHKIRAAAPDWSPTRSGTGGLGCALTLLKDGAARVVHQADWINFNLTSHWRGDSSSALKSGYDPVGRSWPRWVEELGLTQKRRSQTRACGERFGPLSDAICKRFDLDPRVSLVAGTTDGCASFLATGAVEYGDAVTVLGTTLTVKMLSKEPIFDAASGIYSHLVDGKWLVGGASNSGGGVLLDHFDLATLSLLSDSIDGTQTSGLDYYPLSKPGERFPVSDPEKQPVLAPRPQEDAQFLHGMLDGLARIEAASYQKLHEMGASKAGRVFATGGGTQSNAWMAVRARVLPMPIAKPVSVEASYGTARLARQGQR